MNTFSFVMRFVTKKHTKCFHCFSKWANRKCYNVCCLKCCQTVGVHSCKVHKHTAPTIVHPVTTPTTVPTTAPTIVHPVTTPTTVPTTAPTIIHPVTTPTTVPTTVSSDSNTTTIRRSTRVNRGHHSERLNI